MVYGAVRRFNPIGAQQVHFEVEKGRKISNVRALRSVRGLRLTQEGTTVRFEVPGVIDYEVVALV